MNTNLIFSLGKNIREKIDSSITSSFLTSRIIFLPSVEKVTRDLRSPRIIFLASLFSSLRSENTHCVRIEKVTRLVNSPRMTVVIKHKTKSEYIHFDPNTNEYLIRKRMIGSAIFLREVALIFMKATGLGQEWGLITVRSPRYKNVPKWSEKEIYDALYLN